MAMAANTEVLDRAMAAIRKYPDRHYQGSFISKSTDSQATFGDEAPECGTSLCMAGWIAFQNAPMGSLLDANVAMVKLPNGRTQRISDFATDAAELSYDQRNALFYSAGTADDLEAMVKVLREDPTAGMDALLNAAFPPDGEDGRRDE